MSHVLSNQARRFLSAAALALVLLVGEAAPVSALVLSGHGAARAGTTLPRLVTMDTSGLPDSLASELVRATTAWSAAVTPKAACVGVTPVKFQRVDGLKGGYVVQERAILLNPDREAGMMPLVAVHELSHHLMMACDLDQDDRFRADFYAAQHLPPARGWFDYGNGWETAPAEHFAEAVTLLVMGTASGRIPVSEAALEVVAEWIDEG